jgi:formylglycine-generating enzyme
MVRNDAWVAATALALLFFGTGCWYHPALFPCETSANCPTGMVCDQTTTHQPTGLFACSDPSTNTGWDDDDVADDDDTGPDDDDIGPDDDDIGPDDDDTGPDDDDATPDVPGDMVEVPQGSFWMGCAPADTQCRPDESPYHEVFLDGFEIDETEVTVSAYSSCVEAGGCDPPVNAWANCNEPLEGRDDHPINCIDFVQAQSYCAWAGKRLPTEAEWEKTARGADGRIYPWGNTSPDCTLAIISSGGAGCGLSSTWPVGSAPAGASPYGALDMAGNVQEWVSDRYGDDYYSNSPSSNPTGPADGIYRVLRDGNWELSSPALFRSSTRDFRTAGYSRVYLGFRCASSL